MKAIRHAEATEFGVNLWAPDSDRLLNVIFYETPGESLIRRAEYRRERLMGRVQAWKEEHRRKGLI